MPASGAEIDTWSVPATSKGRSLWTVTGRERGAVGGATSQRNGDKRALALGRPAARGSRPSKAAGPPWVPTPPGPRRGRNPLALTPGNLVTGAGAGDGKPEEEQGCRKRAHPSGPVVQEGTGQQGLLCFETVSHRTPDRMPRHAGERAGKASSRRPAPARDPPGPPVTSFTDDRH